MGAIADAFNTAFRAWLVDGVPGSGVNPPDKAEARALGALIEAAIGPASQTIELTGGANTLTLDHQNAWLEIDHATGTTLTIPANADVALPIPCDVFGAQVGAGQITFAPDTGVTLDVAEDQDAVSACQGAVWQLRQIAEDHWRVFGHLQAI